MVHISTSPKIFDNRRPLSKKDYLRCIIVLNDLLAAGIVELRSAKPATYYQYILRFKKLPVDSAKMAELRKEMDNDCDGEAPQFAVPAVPLPPPVADQDLGIVMMSSGDEGDDPGPKPPSPAAPPELGPPEVVPEPLPVEDGIVDVAPPPEVPVPLADGWREKLEGIPLRRIAGRGSGPCRPNMRHTSAAQMETS